jgi:hypothetical protein
MARELYVTSDLIEAAALQASEYFLLDQPKGDGLAVHVSNDHSVGLQLVEELPLRPGETTTLCEFTLGYRDAAHFEKKKAALETGTLAITPQHLGKRRADTMRVVYKVKCERREKEQRERKGRND